MAGEAGKEREEPFRVRMARFSELDEATISDWKDLENRALESNAYLSPRFVIPAVRHLCGPKEASEILFVLVERGNGRASGLSGAGVFRRSPGTTSLPFPHLKAYLSPHSYLTGLLIDRDEAVGVARAFFRFFRGGSGSWRGVEFMHRASEGAQARLLAEVAGEFGANWHGSESIRRAILVPGDGGEKYLRVRITPHRAKMIRQLRRRLEERGEVRWRATFGPDLGKDRIDRFLELEHMGWKGEMGTSLLSGASHEAFFREMAESFRADGRLFMAELLLDDRVIASTANLISGDAGFAFKIGWHTDFSKFSPGILNEVEFIRRAPELCGKLSYIDSGAEDGSFIDRLWGESRGLASGVFATTASGRGMLRGVEFVRSVKRLCKSVIRREDRDGRRK